MIKYLLITPFILYSLAVTEPLRNEANLDAEVPDSYMAEVFPSLTKSEPVGSSDPGIIRGEQTICYQADPSRLLSVSHAVSGTGSVLYQWQSKCLSPNCDWTDIQGATRMTYDPLNLNASMVYRRQATDGDSGVQIGYSNEVKITVAPEIHAGTIGNDQEVASSEKPARLASVQSASGGDGSFRYQWQQSTGANGIWSNIVGATNSSYDPPQLSETRMFRRVVSSCNEMKYSNAIKVTVTR